MQSPAVNKICSFLSNDQAFRYFGVVSETKNASILLVFLHEPTSLHVASTFWRISPDSSLFSPFIQPLRLSVSLIFCYINISLFSQDLVITGPRKFPLKQATNSRIHFLVNFLLFILFIFVCFFCSFRYIEFLHLFFGLYFEEIIRNILFFILKLFF